MLLPTACPGKPLFRQENAKVSQTYGQDNTPLARAYPGFFSRLKDGKGLQERFRAEILRAAVLRGEGIPRLVTEPAVGGTQPQS